MEKLNACISETENAILDEFKKSEEDFLNSFIEINKSVEKIGNDANFSSFAAIDLNQNNLEDCTESPELPQFIRIGNLVPAFEDQLVTSGIIKIPALLPFSKASGTSFILTENNHKYIHKLFEQIAIRLMLSMPLNLCRFYFVDNNYGRDFALMNRIDKKVVGVSILNPGELNNLIKELEQRVMELNSKHLVSAQNLVEYNRVAEDMQEPYYFVFITNFPSGFSSETAERLFNLINKNNAERAGIFLFFSIDKSVKAPIGVDVDKFSEISQNIYQNNNNDYQINNSDFSKEFNEKFNLIPDKEIPSSVEMLLDLINKKKEKKRVVSFEHHYSKLIKEDDLWKENSTDGLNIPIGYINPQKIQYLEFGRSTQDFFGLIGGLPGTGKTVLLHNLILWGAIEYSPLELNYYLIDCKNGTGFNPYSKLPHTRILSISNDRELFE